MKKLAVFILTLLLLLNITACDNNLPAEEEDKSNDIVILFTSDVHGAIDSGWTYSGIDVLRRQLIAKGCKVILVDNGDAIQGEILATMTSGSAVIELMNALGYDIATIGNHEFDYGMDRFLELAEMADFLT